MIDDERTTLEPQLDILAQVLGDLTACWLANDYNFIKTENIREAFVKLEI